MGEEVKYNDVWFALWDKLYVDSAVGCAVRVHSFSWKLQPFIRKMSINLSCEEKKYIFAFVGACVKNGLLTRINTYWAKLAISYLRDVMGNWDVAEAVDGVASEYENSNVNKS